MKLNFKNSPTITSDDMQMSKMGLADESAELFQFYLRSKIYSDKILAPIREYISNSIDENLKYMVDKPVEVKIETINGQYIWSCRDHAKGLSESDIRNVFCMYGRSTKRDNNTQLGSFGLGSKSFMAYTDSFYINSHFEGVKTQYACMLSAGEGGVPVGEIYKVLEEPTSESGIEVSADITKDFYFFNQKTIQFVRNFLPDANIIYTDVYEDVYKPLQPLLTKNVDEFVINLYDNGFDQSSYNYPHVAIRMGGVVYKMRSDIRVTNPKGKIVVDVPIGKLTIPISREDIEDTPNNRKVLDDIQKAINQIVVEDRSNITTPKFGESILEGSYNSDYSGEWFKYSFSSTFPDSWNLKGKLEYLHTGYNHNIVNDKHTVYLIPNIKSYKSWVKRLDNYIATVFPTTRIVCMKKPVVDIVSTDTLDVSDVIFVDVKTLGLPKLPKQGAQTEYLVFFDGFKKGTYTAEDLDEYVTTNYFNGEEISDGWEKNIKTINNLKRRVVGMTGDYGISNTFWVCNSKKMYEQLMELGWFNPSSKEYTDRVIEIRAEEKVKEDMNNAEYRVKNALFRMVNPSPRTIKAIGKNSDKLSKIEKVKSLIMREDSFRGRILENLSDSYKSKVTREDLRKLLLMK
jgi:hypothetical protein